MKKKKGQKKAGALTVLSLICCKSISSPTVTIAMTQSALARKNLIVISTYHNVTTVNHRESHSGCLQSHQASFSILLLDLSS